MPLDEPGRNPNKRIIMRKPLVAWVLISFLLTSCTMILNSDDAAPVNRVKVGEVLQFYGEASATFNLQSRSLAAGSSVYEGDQIRTGTDTRLKLLMADSAEIILGDETSLLIEEYGYEQVSRPDKAELKVVKGVFHSRSGKIARARPKRFRIKTAFASIGVKGTEFWGGFWEDGQFDVALLKGKGVVISNRAGTVEITNIGWGTTLVSDTIAPTPPKQWGQAKLNKAIATVAWKKKEK